jgi:hypothetical protein
VLYVVIKDIEHRFLTPNKTDKPKKDKKVKQPEPAVVASQNDNTAPNLNISTQSE